jgi:propanol-preferring alcohol dehydrogenase
MRCMVCHAGRPTLSAEVRPDPRPAAGEVVIAVHACGVCRTDLHVVDGDLPPRRDSVVPGHEVVGVVRACGADVMTLRRGDRVGVPWLGSTCGRCTACRGGRENLCDKAEFTGWTRDGGFADHIVADADFCLPLPASMGDADAAPLLCAGLIGYRAWRAAGPIGDVRRLGIYGFGAAAHILAQVAGAHGQETYAFTRPDDRAAQRFARDLGCVWAGGSDVPPPHELDAAIIFAPVGALVPAALAAICKGGTVVCGGIHMSDIPSFRYRLIWGERRLVSVANLTRADGREFLALAASIGVRTHPVRYRLDDANGALADLRAGAFNGAAVLVP